jgi:hypothetical protein
MSRRERFSHPLDARNTLFLRRFFCGAALATTCGVLVCAQAGCMIPQTVDPIVTTPHSPPQFVPETNIPPNLLPRVLTLFQQGSGDVSASPPCHCRLDFEGLTVEEPDSTVTLDVFWFVDYDPSNVPSTQPVFSETLEGDFNDVTKTRRNLNTFSFDAASLGIVSSGTHVVEVVVGEDGGFDPASTTLPHRAMKQGYTSANFKFLVDLHLEQISGTCPSTLPSRRVCQ